MFDGFLLLTSSTLGLLGKNSKLSVSETLESSVGVFGVEFPEPGVRTTDCGVDKPDLGVLPFGVFVGVGVFDKESLCEGDGVYDALRALSV